MTSLKTFSKRVFSITYQSDDAIHDLVPMGYQ